MPGPLGAWGCIAHSGQEPMERDEVVLRWAGGLGYDQKYMEMGTSVPKSGPRRLNLPQQVGMVDNHTGML